MATNYPSGLDSFTNPAGTDALSTGHAAQHANANDAVEAIEAELGTNPSGSELTVKARFETIEANDWVTTARIGNSQVTSAKIADATITGSDIATGTVTSTNIANDTIVNADVNSAAAIDKTKIAGTAVTVADTGTVTSTMILDGTIVNGDINASAAIAATKISGTAVTQGDTGTVTSTMIADATITGGDIASGTVTSTNIANDTIVNADINSAAAIDVSKLSGVVPSASVGNLLTANQATGTDALGDTTGFGSAGSSTLTSSTAQAWQGTRSLKAAVSGAEAVGINIGAVGNTATMAPVTAGQTYTLTAQVRASTNRDVGTVIYWRASDGSAVSSTAGSATPCTSTGWTQVRLTAVAPATAAYAISEVSAVSTGAEHLYIDGISLHQGAGGLWALPGTPIANLGTYTDESVGRRIFTWDTVNARWQMTYGDTGLRNLAAAGLLVNDWTITSGGQFAIRRVGSTVFLSLDVDKATASADTITTLPAGFRPAVVTDSFRFTAGSSGANVVPGYIAGAGTVLCYRSDMAGSSARIHYNFQTADAWPTSLPGSASGSIPT